MWYTVHSAYTDQEHSQNFYLIYYAYHNDSLFFLRSEFNLCIMFILQVKIYSPFMLNLLQWFNPQILIMGETTPGAVHPVLTRAREKWTWKVQSEGPQCWREQRISLWKRRVGSGLGCYQCISREDAKKSKPDSSVVHENY